MPTAVVPISTPSNGFVEIQHLPRPPQHARFQIFAEPISDSSDVEMSIMEEVRTKELPPIKILVACNRIYKKLDQYDEFLSSNTTPVISYHEQPSWHVETDVVQSRPPPDPPNGQSWNYVQPGPDQQVSTYGLVSAYDPELYRHQFNPPAAPQPPYTYTNSYALLRSPNARPQNLPLPPYKPDRDQLHHGHQPHRLSTATADSSRRRKPTPLKLPSRWTAALHREATSHPRNTHRPTVVHRQPRRCPLLLSRSLPLLMGLLKSNICRVHCSMPNFRFSLNLSPIPVT
ncbi:hypothetical protein SASPL_154353 [Salvia splendens]|uniref:Uncharacterized protein n=1 Tax=Salvia splendens TaxID=180675 RepID=A0A8X8YZR5_SALSN|nr:hypothetical protein SASPL_154353 [Salvia splendens]